MNKLTQVLLALSLGAGTMGLSTAAEADKYVDNRYYDNRRYDHAPRYRDDWNRGHKRYHDRDHRKSKHRWKHEHHNRRPIIHKQVIVIPTPRYYGGHDHHDHYQPQHRYYERSYSAPSGYSNHEYRSATPVILGGIIGGVIGSEMGKGRGKDAATAAGVILGGSIGRDLSR